ncbi:HU family DNA-binding protein [Arsenophonus apicola]|uniref:HU family DNA-binding protein n=1 Tax=Arsenophonus apicola TaxID=2879119 RepID=UPI003CC91F81
MKKKELVEKIAKESKAAKSVAESVLNAFLKTVSQTLKKGDKVQLIGFGTFEVKQRAARNGRNPSTGKAIKIAASKVPSFKAGQGLKDTVNGHKKK